MNHVVRDYLPLLDQRLLTLFADNLPDIEPNAFHHLLLGKKIRPTIVFLLASALEAMDEKILTWACVVELIHIASLVHDDIIDEATIRRGGPPAHQTFGLKTAVLLGDYCLAEAYRQHAFIATETSLRFVHDITVNLVCGEIAQSLGHQIDIIDEAKYLQWISYKTAGLFEMAAIGPAALLARYQHATEPLSRYGQNIGMAFQLMDDLNDYLGEEKTAGKDVHNDLNERNLTLPPLIAYKTGSPAVRQLILEAFGSKNSVDNAKIIEAIASTGAFEYTHRLAKTYCLRAKTSLSGLFAPSESARALEEIADRLCSR